MIRIRLYFSGTTVLVGLIGYKLIEHEKGNFIFEYECTIAVFINIKINTNQTPGLAAQSLVFSVIYNF